MANSAGLCTDFKVHLLNGSHAFGTQAANAVRTVTTKDEFYLALFYVSATPARTPADTVYNTTGEVSDASYAAGGKLLTNATAPTNDSTTAHWTPSAAVTWTALTSGGAFDCAVLYNDTATSKNEVSVHTFGSQDITAADFTITMPTNDGTTGLIRLA
jgi:hypothetical protein